ncbi:leucine zipper domain-containing protein [Streptomyces sp. NPDC059862]
MGVSRRCVKRWLDRYATEGDAGLQDRSSRPHRSPRRTARFTRRRDRGEYRAHRPAPEAASSTAVRRSPSVACR